MPLVRIDVRGSGGDVSAQAGVAYGNISAWVAAVSLSQPALSAARPRPDAGIFRCDFLQRFVSGGDHRTPRPGAQRSRNAEAHLLRLYSTSVDFGCHAARQWSLG